MSTKFDCHDFLSRLVVRDSLEGWPGDQLAPSAEQVKQQLVESYEVVDIRRTESHASLIALGISTGFLHLAVRGSRGFSEFFKEWASVRLDNPLAARQISPRIVDALITLKTRRKYSISPWTGTLLSTRHSLGPDWYLFPNHGSGFIAGMLSAPPFIAHDTVWIVPAIRRILFVGDAVEKPGIVDNCSWVIPHLAKRIRSIREYLKSGLRKVVICDAHCDFGHYVWNVLPAWSTLFDLVPPERVGAIACADTDSYFGSIKDVFGLHSHKITEQRILQPDHLYDLAFRKSYLLSSISSDYITESTAQRVVSHSMSRCNPDFKERLIAMHRERWPIVLFSLRLDNRSWVDQIEGFGEIAARLRRDFPNAGFVIHGMSKGVARIWNTAWMSLEAEIEAAAALECVLGGPAHTANAVGLSIHESVAIANLCDVFLAPVGSGMALYKWLTNKPGVAFSNTFCANPANPGRWTFLVFEGFRANMIPSTYIPLSAVTDVETDRHGQTSRANFTLDRSVLYATLRNLLLSLPWESRAIPKLKPTQQSPAHATRLRKRPNT